MRFRRCDLSYGEKKYVVCVRDGREGKEGREIGREGGKEGGMKEREVGKEGEGER